MPNMMPPMPMGGPPPMAGSPNGLPPELLAMLQGGAAGGMGGMPPDAGGVCPHCGSPMGGQVMPFSSADAPNMPVPPQGQDAMMQALMGGGMPPQGMPPPY